MEIGVVNMFLATRSFCNGNNGGTKMKSNLLLLATSLVGYYYDDL